MQDALRDIPPQKVAGELARAETRDLFQKVESGLDRLVPRSEARFLPDSVVGRITIQAGGEAVTLFFQPEEEVSPPDVMLTASPMTEVMQRVGQLSRQLLERNKEQGDE